MRILVVAVFAAVLASAGLMACNSLLGIDEASREPSDGAPPGDAGEGGSLADTDYHLNCATYCAVIAAACSGANAEYVANPDVCPILCTGFAQDESAVTTGTIDKNTDPSTDAATADTLNCRLWHANFAIVEHDPRTHCPHAGPLGGRKCGDPCQSFCELDTLFCAGPFAAYDGGLDECLRACRPDNGGFGATYVPTDPEAKGVAASTVGNTLACRMYHLEAALDPNGLGKAVHCMHTSQASSPDTCGAPVQDH
jgi:hypothetical protein